MIYFLIGGKRGMRKVLYVLILSISVFGFSRSGNHDFIFGLRRVKLAEVSENNSGQRSSYRRWTRELFLKELKAIAGELGTTSTAAFRKDKRGWNLYFAFIRHKEEWGFKNWAEALNAAGLEPVSTRWSKEAFLEELRKVAARLGTTSTTTFQRDRIGRRVYHAFIRHKEEWEFKNWREAVETAGIELSFEGRNYIPAGLEALLRYALERVLEEAEFSTLEFIAGEIGISPDSLKNLAQAGGVNLAEMGILPASEIITFEMILEAVNVCKKKGVSPTLENVASLFGIEERELQEIVRERNIDVREAGVISREDVSEETPEEELEGNIIEFKRYLLSSEDERKRDPQFLANLFDIPLEYVQTVIRRYGDKAYKFLYYRDLFLHPEKVLSVQDWRRTSGTENVFEFIPIDVQRMFCEILLREVNAERSSKGLPPISLHQLTYLHFQRPVGEFSFDGVNKTLIEMLNFYGFDVNELKRALDISF